MTKNDEQINKVHSVIGFMIICVAVCVGVWGSESVFRETETERQGQAGRLAA